jgi:formylglycine-generating enzyme required for sulfatase activity
MLLSRRELLAWAASAAGLCVVRPTPCFGGATEFKFDPEANVIHAPSDPALWPEFRKQLTDWRTRKRAELRYSDALYSRKDFDWVPSSFACCFLMLCDETFYDHRKGRYQVREFLERGRIEFGGYDSLVLWHAYPRIGLDNRNQFDFYRDMPGGLKGLREVVDEVHRNGVKAFIDYNPWDEHTRREGKPDLEALVEMIVALDADGIFLDTMDRGSPEFRARLDAARPGTVLEGEIALPLERVADHHMSWAQWFGDSAVPGVLRNKWFERRHMQHQISRWNPEHSAELHQAWMNGSGMMIWENVFGSWNGWNQRDRALLRSMLPIQRRFARLFAGEAWTPLVPTGKPDVYASLWEAEGVRLWTLVTRNAKESPAAIANVDLRTGERLYDVIKGETIGRAEFLLPARGIGCLVAASPAVLGDDFTVFLETQKRVAAGANWSTESPTLTPRLKTVRQAKAKELPQGMLPVPAASLAMKVEFRVRECGFYDSSNPLAQGPGAPALHQPIWFERPASLGAFAMDGTLVTNARYAQFLDSSGYEPRHPHHFLKHWVGGAPPPGKEEHPVVYVDLDDARAFAAWAGKRLPTEEEWQIVAQGTDGRKYPWGAEMLPDVCNAGQTGGTTPVGAFPEGRSPFGLYDMCGNVWQWTESERSDGHTRFAILRGGSFYRRGGSDWYFDEGPKPVWFAAKMLLHWPGLDRCANIGFRCAISMEAA